MYISKLSLRNYRNFLNAKLCFNEGINTIVGENGSGKTNVFRAIRLLLDDNLLRYSYKLDENDFNRGLLDWRGHWIIISLEFSDISEHEEIQALFLHGLAAQEEDSVRVATYNLIFRPSIEIRSKLSSLKRGDKPGLLSILEDITIDDYETLFTGKSEADFNDDKTYKSIVGDFETVDFPEEIDNRAVGLKIPHQLSISKEISFTFTKALRDVVTDFQNNRTNPLLRLLKSKSDEVDPKKLSPIVEMVVDLNQSIEELEDVQSVRNDIRSTIKDTVGETYSPKSISIRSGLSSEADELFQSLKLFIGESGDDYEGAIHELSLGGANLIYLTLKLLEFKYIKARNSIANFLLIEEPEAHIHTHIQKTLFEKIDYGDTQIIYSTHSTHISEVSNISSVNVLGREKNVCTAFSPSNGLAPIEIRNLQRYLDAVRSTLLFAKSVLLVEGDAEEILIPVLVKTIIGVSLDELGISLINIRSTGFENVARIFHSERVRKKCTIITDLDSSPIDTNPSIEDGDALSKKKARFLRSQEKGQERRQRLEDFAKGNPWVDIELAKHTFEIDFIISGNAYEVIETLPDIYTDKATIERVKDELNSGDISIIGPRVLTMANNKGKGWFAISLSEHVTQDTYLPNYIASAIFNTSPELSRAVITDICSYRTSFFEVNSSTDECRRVIDLFLNEKVDLDYLKKTISEELEDDHFNEILSFINI